MTPAASPGNANAPGADALLAQALARYRDDPARGDFLIEYACAVAPDPLPARRIAYKFYNRERRFELAREHAGRALAEAARRIGLADGVATWTRDDLAGRDGDLASHVRLALKALAYISLRMGDEAGARPFLDTLSRLDPEDGSGVSVVAALLESLSPAR